MPDIIGIVLIVIVCVIAVPTIIQGALIVWMAITALIDSRR